MGAGDFGEDVFYFTFGRVEIKTPIGTGSIPINFGDEGDFWIDKVLDYNQVDKYNTYHECEYGGSLPEEHTCLLWEDEDA